MQNSNKQTVGIFGSGPVASAAARQLVDTCQVVVFDPRPGDTLYAAGVETVSSLAALCARTNLVIAAQLHSESETSLGTLGAALGRGATIIDLMPGDPSLAQDLAKDLAERGVTLVDAPIHCEQMDRFPEDAAILCGASPSSWVTVKALLERICPNVVVCGDIGSGHAARAVVAAVAVCNRLVAYECAAMGLKNGLTVSDMATVLNRSSGASSATARVLPALAEGKRTSDASLAVVAAELEIGSQLARRVGAPMLIANQALSQVLGASRALGPDATLDDLRRLVEVASDVSFTL
jgi:3-hydroxyisobutyrate dehydrogenase